VRPSDLDAVTIDAFGTLVMLDDPVGELATLLPEHDRSAIAAAFEAEAAYYLEHSVEGRGAESLAQLHASCTSVFNAALGSSLTAQEYVGALKFAVLPGVVDALRRLSGHGFALAVVANWDCSLHTHLAHHGLERWFDVVVTSAEAGKEKPEPAPFELALSMLTVRPERALHIGDNPATDEVGARAAGLHFAPAPVPQAVEDLL
jgi:HAD superfamily hydrolase (TIGR01549 family)